MKKLLAIAIAAATIGMLPRTGWTQSPALTTVKDTVYTSDGSLASGSVVVTWQSFLTGDSKPVFGGSKTSTLTNGALAVELVPNVGATPAGTSFRVRFYQSGTVFAEENWVVPTSSPLATPAAPTVTPQGTPGSTTHCYWITARNGTGETRLSPVTCISNGAATLNGTDYNLVDWPDVSGATSYRVFRTNSSTAPSGTCPGGAYPACGVVGTPASSTLNDQSNNTSSGTVPTVNDTDPKTLSAVRVLAAPSPEVIISPSQVTGEAVVKAPTAGQTITAASTGVPLAVKGKSGNTANVLEVYDNQATPQLQSYFNQNGDARFKDLNAVRMADQFPGADAGEKIDAAIADLPSTGGTVDARGLEGAQSVASTVADGGKTVRLLLGDTRISSSTSPVFTLTGNGSGIEGVGASFADNTRGTVISHSGSGAALQLGNATNGVEGVRLSGFRVSGTSSGTHGIKAWSRVGHFERIVVDGYTGGSAIGLELITSDASPNFLSYSNTCLNCEIRNNTTLVRLTDATVNGGTNNNQFLGGRYLGPFTTGFLLDNALYTLLSGTEVGISTVTNAVGVDVTGTSEFTTLLGGLVEGVSGTGGIGVRTASGTLATRVLNVGLDANTTIYQDNSTDKTRNVWWHGIINEFPETLRIFGSSGGSGPIVRYHYAGDNIADLAFIGGGNFSLQAGPGGADPIHMLTSGEMKAGTRLRSAQEAVTFSSTPAFNAALGNSFKMTLTGNVTSSTISNAQTGQFLTLLLCQDGTGNRTMAWPSNLKLAGGAFTLTTTGSKCDSVTAVYDGTNWYETGRAANL